MRKKLVGVASVAIMATAFAGKASAATYEVKPGDSLWSIANQFKTTVASIKQSNKLTSDIIFPNQVLQITQTEAQVGTQSVPQQAAAAHPPSSSGNSQSTYTVKQGDFLIKIANMHNITLAELKEWNGLSSDIIRPGQVLKVQGTRNTVPAQQAASPASTPSSSSAGSNNGASSSTYTVVPGDTLGKIAARFGTTVNNLKQLNGISGDIIYAGQKLRINGQAPVSQQNNQVKQSTVQTKSVTETAMGLLGTKYAWGGTTPAGFDCSGFIYYVFTQSGHKIGRQGTDGYFNRSYYVNHPQPGDLVFFQNTYKNGISHMGIYIGNGQFVHAGNSGVEVASVNNSYWKSKFNGYKRFY